MGFISSQAGPSGPAGWQAGSGWNFQDGIFRKAGRFRKEFSGWNCQDGRQISGWNFQNGNFGMEFSRYQAGVRMESELLGAPLRPGKAFTMSYMELCARVTGEN